MNLSPSSLLVIVVVTSIANILILAGVSARTRGNRARRLAAVEGMLAASYVDVGPGIDRGPNGPRPGSWYIQPTTEAADTEVANDEPTIASPERPTLTLLAAADRETEEVATATVTGSAVPALRGRDPLTGLLDPVAFDDALAHEDAREQRYGRSATVVIFELDGLARLVERLGSDAGERIESALADTISRLARRADYIARLEAGRYAVLLPETDEVAAINYVERIRRACDLWLESGAIAMRLAIGWASTGGEAALAGAIRSATERMRVELRRNARLATDVNEVPADEEATGL